MFDFKLTKTKKNSTLAVLTGPLNEHVAPALARLASQIPAGPVALDCAAIHDINSAGASLWSKFVESLVTKHAVTFVNCSVFFSDYAVVVTPMVQGGKVESFHVPTRCSVPTCKREQDVLITKGDESLVRHKCEPVRQRPLASESPLDDFLALFEA